MSEASSAIKEREKKIRELGKAVAAKGKSLKPDTGFLLGWFREIYVMSIIYQFAKPC